MTGRQILCVHSAKFLAVVVLSLASTRSAFSADTEPAGDAQTHASVPRTSGDPVVGDPELARVVDELAANLRVAQVPTTPTQPLAPRIDSPSAPSSRTSTPPAPRRPAGETQTPGTLSRSLFAPVSVSSSDSAPSLIGPGTDIVAGSEGILRRTGDVGGLAAESTATRGISSHRRNAVANDVRIRGHRAGQNIGAGSFWSPGRADLDTALNKVFSYNVAQLQIIKGPYSARYGPGFNFVDMQLLKAPRFDTPGWRGTTSINYETNGEVFQARQNLWGGGEDWGARVHYGHGTGNDYLDGSDFLTPNSFKSRDLFATLGFDLTDDKSLEISYLRLDQTDVEFPGLVFDINWLVTDGIEIEYQDRDAPLADYLNVEAWYNRTRFEGDTLRPAKNRQLPFLEFALFSPSGFDGFAITDVDGSSTGYRIDWTWDLGASQVTAGTDVIYLDTTLNDIEPLLPANDNNFPIPHSNSADVGLFAEYREQVNDQWNVRLGGRLDFVKTRSSDFVNGVPAPISVILDSELEQHFSLWGAYLTTDYNLSSNWMLRAGGGFAQRPPTLTELYAVESFIGTLQQGLTFVLGDPQLDPESLRQIDVELAWDYGNLRGSLAGFYSWIRDYITYDLTTNPDDFGLTTGVAFVNTELATLAGFEMANVYDLSPSWSLFSKAFFVEGRDRSRTTPSRLLGPPRSGVAGREREPLPGIVPFEGQIGLRWHDAGPENLWGVELSTRIVDRQDRIAESLGEIGTPGFTIWNVSSYFQLTDRVLFVTGVDNLTDKFYREHLDYLSGFGVFRKGVNFYFGMDVSY